MSVKTKAKSMLLPDPGPRPIAAGLARGVRMHIDFTTQTQLYLGLYEIELTRFLRSVLRPGARVFDVGVQHGYDSLLFANQTRAPVAGFECDGTSVARARENVELNAPLAPLVQTILGEVGDQPGQTSLDGWAYDGGFIPDFIKLDIDGGEAGALRSARRLLSERRPALLVEVHSVELEQECGRLLVEHGYKPVIINQRRFWREWRPIAHNRWLVAPGR